MIDESNCSPVLQICGCHGNYTLVNREEACIEMIRKKVGDANVLVSILK